MVLRHLAKSTQQNNDRKFTLLLSVKAQVSPAEWRGAVSIISICLEVAKTSIRMT